jgi:hypothetical protein
MSQEFAAGASAARHNLATFLRQHEFRVETSRYGCPPTNEDFLASVLQLLEGRSCDGRVTLVIFHWWGSTYQILVSRSEIEKLSDRPGARHYLFSATTDDHYRPDRYQHDFYLAANENGDVVVHHERRWKKTWEIEDTTILYIGG